MMKRELDKITGAVVDVDAPRSKRRRDGTIQDETESIVVGEMPGNKQPESDFIKVAEEGTKLWTTIREAVNKDGRTLSNDFVRLPSKRQYADYYQQTKRPVCLEDIKYQLDSGLYRSLENVKIDLEMCFRNAKRYNMKDSQIWKDAKHLHKLVSREYAKMTGITDDSRVDVENDGDDNAAPVGSDEEGGRKKKAPNLIRLLKARLQKLVDKTDDTGRVLSSEFMDLPNKKQWPVYYKTIKKPQCLENIFKRLRRKEYHIPIDFCRDVELVFSNAMEFNAENSQIYEDARVLREFFHHSMSDLPPPYTVPEYSSSATSSKIMLKLPPALTSYPSTSEAPVTSAYAPTTTASTIKSSGSVLLRLPGLHVDNQPPSQARASPTAMSPVVSTPKATPIAIPRTSTMTSYASATHYPNAAYQQHAEQPAPNLHTSLPLQTGVNDVNSNVNTSTRPSTKSPVPSPARTFRCMVLITKPQERRLELDHTEGVRVWAMRLGKNETSLSIRGIQFTVDEEEEDDMEMDKEEEEEEDEDEVPEVKVKGRGRKKGKARAAAVKVVKASTKKQKSNSTQDEELSVRINGSVIQAKSEPLGEWDVDVPWGPNVLEVSEKGGAAWKVYIDRGA